MARIDNLTNFLNDVSSAIKQKIGDSAPILASEFDTKIAEIETRGNYQQKSVTISNNGTQIFTPDANYDAIEQIEITTNVPILQLQTKSVEITSNGNISVLPDTEYDGMSQIDLVVNVPSLDTSDATATPEDILDEKTAYVNGEKITGNVPSYSSAWIDTGSSDDPDITIDESTVTEVSGNTYESFRMMGQEIHKHNKFIVDSEVGSNNVIISTKSTNVAKAVGVRPDRIKKDETILGVTGTYEGIDTSDADATDLDIIKDKTAYINGVKVTGRLPIDRDISADNHYNADTYLHYGPVSSTDHPQVVNSLRVSAKPHFPEHWIQKRVVENGVTSLTITFPASQLLSYMSLTTDKLLAGQKIWYLTGTATSDANATADDIAKDKTAYVNGVKIVGTNEGVTPTGTKSITENGTFDITSFANVDVNVPTTGVMTQEEYDEAVATLDDLLYGNYQEVYSVMNGITDTPTDEYNGVGGTPTQIENTIDTLLGVNN